MQTERTREEHLAWCKARALAELEAGSHSVAVASMIFDLGKWREALYEPEELQLLAADGRMFCRTPDMVRHWIKGFM